MISLRHSLQQRLEDILNDWTRELIVLQKRESIVALHFGAQKCFDGFEVYLGGHTWYDDHDLWLLEADWYPEKNYISLGEDSLELDRLELLNLYKEIVEEKIRNSKPTYKRFDAVFVGLVDGDPIQIK
jgi:hypothetical protein